MNLFHQIDTHLCLVQIPDDRRLLEMRRLHRFPGRDRVRHHHGPEPPGGAQDRARAYLGGVGARLAFAVAASNGAGPAIARFSIAHHITGSAAWVAALIMMALADVLTALNELGSLTHLKPNSGATRLGAER